MRVAIVTSQLGKRSETFVTRHIESLNQGNNVVLYKIDQGYSGDIKPSYKISDNWWNRLPGQFASVFKLLHLLIHNDINIPEHSERKKIAEFLGENNVDIILAEYGKLGCMIQPVAEELNLPLFTYFRGHDASTMLKSWHVKYSYKKLIHKMNGVFAVSPHLLDNLKRVGVTWKQAHVIPSGTDTQEFYPDIKDPKLFLSVGRFVPKKAPDITIKAFAIVNKKHPDTKLIMIGDGPLLDNCKLLAKSLNVYESINFTGSLQHNAISEYMSRSSIFLLHSVTDANGNTEGFPSVIQEAMASGCAIISTNHGGIPYFVDHQKTGLLSDEYNIEKFTENVLDLMDNTELVRELGKRARDYAMEHFEYRKLYNKVELVMRESVKENGCKL